MTKLQIFAFSTIFLLSSAVATATVKTYNAHGSWTVSVDDADGAVTIVHDGDTLVNASRAEWGLRAKAAAPKTTAEGNQATENKQAAMDAKQATENKQAAMGADQAAEGEQAATFAPRGVEGRVKVAAKDYADDFGKALRVTVTGRNGRETAVQNIDIYPDYILTRLEVENPAEGELNYLAPIATTVDWQLFSRPGNYVACIPFDNDAWVRYVSAPFGADARDSYEVGALFNADTREGLVVGSIEHDLWKTAIETATKGACTVDTLKVYGGASSTLTRDVRPHGAVKGPKVASPRIAVIPAEDWRKGMDLYADLCAVYAPRIASGLPRPFGWNSWGKLATKITFDKAMEVADFIHSDLQGAGFADVDGKAVVNLDAFWDFGFKPEHHPVFVKHCRDNNLVPGIYYCPFTDWGRNPDATVGEMPEYKMGDLYLRVDGKPLEFDGAYALDPTHPGTRARIKATLDHLAGLGYEYIKIDFMGHGAYEADSHFDPEVTTGIAAYNRGMAFIDSVIDGRMWINLSIAPLFPANYAHSRRISCDSWADIKNTEYTLNALTYGWWLDRVYLNNDADHIVLEGVTDGENRARVTSSAITGVYFLGDDMSLGGDPDVRRRVIRNVTNEEINEMARRCGSFRPVEYGDGEHAADAFVNEDADYVYVALFNFGNRPAERRVPLRRVGLDESQPHAATELWSRDTLNISGAIRAGIPAKDVKVYRIRK